MQLNLRRFLFLLFLLLHSTGNAQSVSEEHGRLHPAAVAENLCVAGIDLFEDVLWYYSAPARVSRDDMVPLLLVAAGYGAMLALDEPLDDAIVRSADHWFVERGKRLLDPIEDFGSQGYMNKFYAGILLLGYVADCDPLVHASGDLLASFILSQPPKFAANLLIGRRRPYEGYGPWRYEPFENATSFPSGHSSTAFQTARILSHHIGHPSASILLYSAAVGVSIQRSLSRNHWPSDVLLGAVFGYFSADGIVKHRSERRHGLDITAASHPTGAPMIGLTLSF
jgi:hypothetical protein